MGRVDQYLSPTRATWLVLTKLCKKCGRYVNIMVFGKKQSSADGRQSYCGRCARATTREWDRGHRQHKILAMRKLRATRPQGSQAGTVPKYRKAIYRRVKLKVSKGEITVPKSCQHCDLKGLKLEGHHYRGYKHPYELEWLCRSCHKLAHSGVRDE